MCRCTSLWTNKLKTMADCSSSPSHIFGTEMANPSRLLTQTLGGIFFSFFGRSSHHPVHISSLPFSFPLHFSSLCLNTATSLAKIESCTLQRHGIRQEGFESGRARSMEACILPTEEGRSQFSPPSHCPRVGQKCISHLPPVPVLLPMGVLKAGRKMLLRDIFSPLFI